jgi:hypothetical protein
MKFFLTDSGHSTLPGEDPGDEMMNRYSPEFETETAESTEAADAIQVLESVIVEAETKSKETDEKFRDLTEVRGSTRRDGVRPNWQNRTTPGVKNKNTEKGKERGTKKFDDNQLV